jgi:hypothetical protein
MGRPIGSVNRQKPFADALRMEICAGNDPRHLRAIARKLFEKALDGDLQAIREIADRLDGSPRRLSSAATSRWTCCLTENCSRSFAVDRASH